MIKIQAGKHGVSLSTILLICLLQAPGLTALGKGYDGTGAAPAPSVSQHSYSKLIGIMVKDKNGKVECVTGTNGPVSGFKPCDSQVVSLAMAAKPNGAKADVQTAGAPFIIAGAAASCAMTGAFSEIGAELFQSSPNFSAGWQALHAFKGALVAFDGVKDVLVAIWKGAGAASKAWPAAQTAIELGAAGSTAVLVPVTVAVCMGSYKGGRAMVRDGVKETATLAAKKVYYFFSKTPQDIQGN